jgi:transcription elongation GreA/GreB family factor
VERGQTEGPKPILAKAEMRPRRVAVGDTVRIRYLTDDRHVVQFTISAERSDPSDGVIHYKKPIAAALLGAEEGDEVEILVGSYPRPAILEKIADRLH